LKTTRLFTAFVVALLCVSGLEMSARAASEPTVVVILIDGLPAVALENAQTPTFDRLKREGVWSDSLVPVFPSVSHSNWSSLSTGCWPERHGIVSNQFEIDGVATDFETITDADSLLDCEPIHVVAENHGISSAALGVVGATSATRGDLARTTAPYFDTWSSSLDATRAEQIVEQLKRTDVNRPRLISAYFNGPDTILHDTGIGSDESREAVENSDRALGLVVDQITAMRDDRDVTLVVVTDHGMIMADRMFNLAKLMRNKSIAGRYIADGPVGFIYLDDPTQARAVLRALQGDSRYNVTLPEDQPAHWHLGTSPRVGQLIVYASPPYFFPMNHDMPSWVPPYESFWPLDLQVPAYIRKIGMHGYDPKETPEMNGIFFAWGSGIKQVSGPLPPIQVIDIHPTITHLLDITSANKPDGRPLTQILK